MSLAVVADKKTPTSIPHSSQRSNKVTDFPKSMLNLVYAESRKSIQTDYLTGPFELTKSVSPNMPAPAPALPPVAVQVAEISIGLNAAMFLTFLMGLCLSTSYLHRHNLTVFRYLYNGLLWHRVPLWQVCLQL